MSVNIQTFSNADKVPGPYGEVVYGAGGETSGSIPLVLLLTGLATGGAIVADTQIQPVYSLADIDYYAGAGSELATMAYDALANQQDIAIFLGAPTAPGGAVASTLTLTITITGGSNPSSGGSVIIRVDGEPVIANYSTTDTATTIAASIASAIEGSSSGRLGVTATSTAGVVTIADRTPSVRGNQRVIFVDPQTTRGSGVNTFLGGINWAATTAFALNATAVPVPGNGYWYVVTVAGTTSGSQPSWPTTIGTTVTDGTVTWKCAGLVVTGGGCTMGLGSGLETYTNLLETIVNRQFDRIGLACNDATSLGLWDTQVSTTDPQATVGILEHAVVAMNGTLAAAQSISQTTLNAQRFQVMWQQNSETPPWRMAAGFAADRCAVETNDPASDYDGYIIANITPQSQQADWPNHTTLVACLNTGLSPVITNGDGNARMCRSVTSHCLSGSNPDYSTLDTSEAVVPDFICQDLKTYFSTVYQPANPRVQPDPSADDPLPVTGVGYPANFNSCVLNRLQLMEAGKLPGTCPPIITNVAENQPVSDWNPVGERIMTAVPSQTARGNHQVGLSIRQVG